MIYDCFTFFNELDLLEIRLEELWDCVDKFVLVEATETQSKIKKPLYFNKNKDRFSKYLSKISHVIADQMPNISVNKWAAENFQRNCISIGVKEAKDDDIILISDIDEIPSSICLKSIFIEIENDFIKDNPISFAMDFYAYYLNLVSARKNDWVGTVAVTKKNLDLKSPQYFRSVKDFSARIFNSGWHFSWLGGPERIYEKAVSCIEPLDKSNLPSKDEFVRFFNEYAKRDNLEFVSTENLSFNGKKLKKMDDLFFLPNYVKENIDRYSSMILK
jgi:beta-1,4-mannosyl-glycoprotein beta-1,4-N-acetylglucosaminyltransferase